MIAQVVEGTSDAVLVIDQDQRIVYANAGASAMFGYQLDELTGRSLTILIPERHVPRHADHVRSFGRSGETSRRMGERRDVVGQRRTGEEFPAEAGITRIASEGAVRYGVILRDVSERRQREDELRLKSN
ncbi:MAG TPA: PAS domain-containing protein, partial [Thermoflexales bacterium]|nr:PAS domain-containing protein [Thermoflexales bacterium]